MTPPAPYPLLFEPVLLPKVWGGDRLAAFGKAVPPGARIGESWEVADLAETSASGAGVGGVCSVIANGPLKGKTLRDAVGLWGPRLLGDAALIDGGFPLLVKLLDARENLSVQVHPSPAFAAAHPGAKLKTECWYILEAGPESVIYKGVRPGVSRERFEQHIREGTVVEALVRVPAVVGECHNLPSGTVHALGAGVVVAEVQTPSDTTFRVYDWGREGRALHIAESLECIDFGTPPPGVKLSAGGTLRTEFFAVWQPEPGKTVRLREQRACVVMPLRGWGHAFWWGQEGITEIDEGQTILVPASIATSFEFTPAGLGRSVTLVAQLQPAIA